MIATLRRSSRVGMRKGTSEGFRGFGALSRRHR
jgi:hypothetical protein